MSQAPPPQPSNAPPPPPEHYIDFLDKTTPRGWSTEPAHIQLIADHLDKVANGEIDRLAIFMPPRHAKSETVTYRFPVYWLKKNPTDNVLVTGYNERFARKFGRRTRNLASAIGITGDKKSADEWETKQGGLLMTRGVGSPPTGSGFQCIIIDDPVRRREDAESPTMRDKVRDWYTDDLYNRLEPGGAIILIMTLWHVEDIGKLAIESEPGRWTVLKLPAFATENDPLGRDVGQALWPARYDAESLNRIRGVMSVSEGERSWEALYQQNPQPREGSMFKWHWFNDKTVTAVPAEATRALWFDKAATDDGGDYTAGVLMSKTTDNKFYIEQVWRFQKDTYQRDEEIKNIAAQVAAKYGKHGFTVLTPQDPGAAGKDSVHSFVTMLAGYRVKSRLESGAKEVRADPLAGQCGAGNVYLGHGIFPDEWITEFLKELCSFPDGAHDDQVDAAANVFNFLNEAKPWISDRNALQSIKKKAETALSQSSETEDEKEHVQAKLERDKLNDEALAKQRAEKQEEEPQFLTLD